VPIISKVAGISLARIATEIMLGKKLSDFPELKKKKIPYVGVKEAVFPFNMFPEVDPVLGPEMRATGEVMGMADDFGRAFYKAQESAGYKLPTEGNVLVTVASKDRKHLLPIAKKIVTLGLNIFATEGTGQFLDEHDIKNTRIKKLCEGRPNIADAIKNGELRLVINTPLGKESKEDDSYIRMTAIQQKVPYVTSLAAAQASVAGIEAMKKGKIGPKALQEYHAELVEKKSVSK